MAKKLTVNAVNSAAKKVMKEHHLTDVNGEVWTVTVDEQMNPAYVTNMAQDILVLMAKLKDENAIDDFDFEKNYNILLYPMILRYYTDLEITDKKTAVETINSYVNLMENFAIFYKQYPVCMACRSCRMCYHQNSLTILIDIFKHTE